MDSEISHQMLSNMIERQLSNLIDEKLIQIVNEQLSEINYKIDMIIETVASGLF